MNIDKWREVQGHATTSHIKEAQDVLKTIGYEVSKLYKVDNRKKNSIPTGHKLFVRVKFGTRKIGHFLAMDTDGKIYDTDETIYNNKEEMLKEYNKGWQRWHGGKVQISHFFIVY